MTDQVRSLVEAAAKEAAAAAPSAALAGDHATSDALERVAGLLTSESKVILEANSEDVQDGEGKLPAGLLDRLRLDPERLESIASEVRSLDDLPPIEREAGERVLKNGLRVQMRRVPVGVVGAIYEARGNVTVDIATQLIKSRNAGVLRAGGASLRTAAALVDYAIGPALSGAGLDPRSIQLIRSAEHAASDALVSLRKLVRLVIVRGSGETTARLAELGSANGVRVMAHAEGGGVLYVHPSADFEMALTLIEESLDRLAVCNRLNLLLIDQSIWEEFEPRAVAKLEKLNIKLSLPPHDHPIGYEWATDSDREATVTVAPIAGPSEAAALANLETSGLAAGIVTGDDKAAKAFLDEYHGTGGFWNASTRWLDGFQLTGAPETGINIDHVPGPRGPVTYRDLYLNQWVVIGDGSQKR